MAVADPPEAIANADGFAWKLNRGEPIGPWHVDVNSMGADIVFVMPGFPTAWRYRV